MPLKQKHRLTTAETHKTQHKSVPAQIAQTKSRRHNNKTNQKVIHKQTTHLQTTTQQTPKTQTNKDTQTNDTSLKQNSFKNKHINI